LRGNEYQDPEDKGDKQSLEALFDILTATSALQRVICRGARKQEEKAHLPGAKRPDEDIEQQGAQLGILDVKVLPGIEDAGRVKKQKEEYRHQAQPIDVVEPFRFAGYRRSRCRKFVAGHRFDRMQRLQKTSGISCNRT
jgi:hypothetical protein